MRLRSSGCSAYAYVYRTRLQEHESPMTNVKCVQSLRARESRETKFSPGPDYQTEDSRLGGP